MNNLNRIATLGLLMASVSFAAAAPAALDNHTFTTGAFKGIEVNGGTATVEKKDMKWMLKVSSDFKIPNSPAPHYQVVDAAGNKYLLDRLTIVGDKTKRQIVLPSYVKSVAKVQIWCSFAEVLLGEASLAKPATLK